MGLLLAGVTAPARGGDAPRPDWGWTDVDPAEALSDSNPFRNYWQGFGGSFQNSGMDQWCDNMPFTLPISRDWVAPLGPGQLIKGGTVNANRQFFRYANGDVAINDQLELKADIGYSLGWVARLENQAWGTFFGASVDGQSLVTRPMRTADSCKELSNFYHAFHFRNILPAWLTGKKDKPPPKDFDFKIVFPLNAKRLSEMDVGELWIIPMTFQIALEPLDAVATRPSTGLPGSAAKTAFIALGASKTSDPTVTVFRAGPKEIRLKLHLDSVRAFNLQLGVAVGPIPATDIGTPGLEALLSAILPDTLPSTLLYFSRQIDSVLAAQAGISLIKNSGQQVLLQYTVDATDPAQLERLAKIIHGDLSVLRALSDFANIKPQNGSSAAMRKALDGEKAAHDTALGIAAQLAAIDDYNTPGFPVSYSVSASFPVAVSGSASRIWRNDTYVVPSDPDGNFKSRSLLKVSGHGFGNVPLLGSFFNARRSRTVEVQADAQGRPYAIYAWEWGGLRTRQSAVGKAVDKADSVIGGVGMGPVPNPVTRLPGELRSAPGESKYHKGYLDSGIVLPTAALQKILSASFDSVARAFETVLTGNQKALFDFVLAKGRLDENGAIRFGREEIGQYPEYRASRGDDQEDIFFLARHLCRKAERLFHELRDALALAQDPQRQAAALSRLVLGRGVLGAEDFLKMALRLLEVHDIAGAALLHLDRDKTSSANYTRYKILNPKLFYDTLFGDRANVKQSFNFPTPALPIADN